MSRENQLVAPQLALCFTLSNSRVKRAKIHLLIHYLFRVTSATATSKAASEIQRERETAFHSFALRLLCQMAPGKEDGEEGKEKEKKKTRTKRHFLSQFE